MDIPELMTVGEFLARYSIARTTFYREAAKAGSALKLRKLGTATRISRVDAETWANSLPVRDEEAA